MAKQKDTTRRQLLTIVAGGAVAAAIPAARAYPEPDPIYAAIEAHRKAAAAEQAAWDHVNRRPDLSRDDECALTDGPCKEAWDAREKFAETVPTTIPGMRAMIIYANELEDEDPEWLWNPGDYRLLETLATAAEALMDGRVS
jgi:hypothetical protein